MAAMPKELTFDVKVNVEAIYTGYIEPSRDIQRAQLALAQLLLRVRSHDPALYDLLISVLNPDLVQSSLMGTPWGEPVEDE